jgi:IS30 family transposase
MRESKQDSDSVGAPLLSEQQSRYFQLMRQGINNVQACRSVGISRKTGTRWRLGRTEHKHGLARTYAPVGSAKIAPISSRFLSEDERVRIADLRRLGRTVRAIAADLGRAPSTVSRELTRNSLSDRPAYLPHHAHRAAATRRARPKASKLALDAELRAFVAARLTKRWSPEQISHALRVEFPDQPWRHLAIETLYRAVYRPGDTGLERNSTNALRTGRRRRRPHRHPNQRRKNTICDPSSMIDQRPAEADDRAVAGHWEGDLIIGKNGGSAIATLVERTTRYLILLHLPSRRTATTLRDALVPVMRDLPKHLCRSITWDQGKEMALHREFTKETGIPVYFCRPHSPWERGSNENMNGVLRQYFPKSTNLAVHAPGRLAEVAAEINERPRKTLDWETPAGRLAILAQPTN